MSEVNVTQGDRDAADTTLKRLAEWLSEQMEAKISFADHEGDNCEMRQAFAAHRQAALVEGVRLGLEAAGKACVQAEADFQSPEYATGQPLSSLNERYACRTCASEIAALDPEAIIAKRGEG